MGVVTGTFDGAGNPIIGIRVTGVYRDVWQPFDAIVDTGFTGFLSMPLVHAFPLGLVLLGTMNVTLADGSTQQKLTATGTIQIGDETHDGQIILGSGSNELLLGMEFLRNANKTLLVSPQRVLLLDEDPWSVAGVPPPE